MKLLFSTKLRVIRAGIHKMLVRIENREDPDQTEVIWVCNVCLSLFDRQLVLNFLEYLLCINECFPSAVRDTIIVTVCTSWATALHDWVRTGHL